MKQNVTTFNNPQHFDTFLNNLTHVEGVQKLLYVFKGVNFGY